MKRCCAIWEMGIYGINQGRSLLALEQLIVPR